MAIFFYCKICICFIFAFLFLVSRRGKYLMTDYQMADAAWQEALLQGRMLEISLFSVCLA